MVASTHYIERPGKFQSALPSGGCRSRTPIPYTNQCDVVLNVVVGGQNQQWHADLVDVANLKKYNNGTKFLLTVIDVFSKRA